MTAVEFDAWLNKQSRWLEKHAYRIYTYWRDRGLSPYCARRLAMAAWRNDREYQWLKRNYSVDHINPTRGGNA